jgi:ABC-type transport system involved in multi-copper enzyme maturation permease subunit
MNAKTTRILKEARSLFWPWCSVIIAGALRLVEQSHSALMRGGPLWGVHYLIESISFLGFFLGIPLLAALSLGNEFQHRTLPLLLSQPLGRMEIWGEKMSVTIVAALSAALVFCYGWRSALQQDPELWVVAGALIIPMIASATFWTLYARSTMGGLALNGVNSLIPLAWFLRRDWIPETMTARSVAAFAFLSYTGVMLWLGRRTLARFQATGGMAGEDLLVAGPSVMPGALAEWFRCRPTGAVLNLIRKEFRLLRPLWLVTLLTVLGWICLTLFRLVPERGSAGNLPATGVLAGVFGGLIAILAGSLSLGEERTSGTQSWHMTLPMPARRQWLIKLFMALFAGVVCGVLLPTLVLIAGGLVFGSPLMYVDPHAEMVWLLTVSLLSFASFWCACAVSGTVPAVLWLFPMIGALLLASGFGDWVGSGLMDRVVSRFDPFTDFRFTNAFSNFRWFDMAATPTLVLTLLLVPTLLFAVIQSYRLFRVQLQDNALSVIRSLLPLAIMAFLCSFSLAAFYVFVSSAKQQMWTLFRETHEAIEAIHPGTPKLDAAHPLQLTAEDLAKAFPLSERTRRWLGNSRIAVAPDKPHPGPYCCGGNSRSTTFTPDKAYSWYLATIHLPSGSECTVSFQAGRGYGMLGGVCK